MVDLISLGILVVIIGVVLLFIGMIQQTKSKVKVEGGGIFFLGPFPIFGVATSKEIFYVLLAVSVILIVVLLLLGRLIH